MPSGVPETGTVVITVSGFPKETPRGIISNTRATKQVPRFLERFTTRKLIRVQLRTFRSHHANIWSRIREKIGYRSLLVQLRPCTSQRMKIQFRLYKVE